MTVTPADEPPSRPPGNYGRIRRGPMAADAFTQIRNAVFRDVRLSAKAMGIFGNISTHRDGWGVSAESIASQMRDGVSAVKGGLRELEECGYLQRTRVRNGDGTLGGAVYFITDQPEALPEPVDLPVPQQTRRSAPAVENRPQAPTCGDAQNRRSEPAVDSPTLDKPTVVNHPHKKTSSKNTSGKNTLSPPDAPQADRPALPDAADEREIDPLTRKLTTEHQATVDEIETILAKVTAEGRIASIAAWAASPTGRVDIAQRLAQHRRDTQQRASPRSSLPTACQPCLAANPAAAFNPRFRRRNSKPCPDCHPDHAKDAAA